MRYFYNQISVKLNCSNFWVNITVLSYYQTVNMINNMIFEYRIWGFRNRFEQFLKDVKTFLATNFYYFPSEYIGTHKTR